MADRLEWQLVPLVKESQREVVEALAEEALKLDAVMEVAPQRMRPVDQDRLLDLQRRMDACVESPCEAAEAPPMASRPTWNQDAHGALTGIEGVAALPLDAFLSRLGNQPDCARCPGACRYPGVSGMPCDFDLSPLSLVLTDKDLLDHVQFELSPPEMEALAARLDAYRIDGWYSRPQDVDPEEYLADASRFLRFWSKKGFGVAPAYATAEDRDV